MRVINALLGLVFTVLGLTLVCYAGCEWNYISYTGLFWLCFVGLVLAAAGSVGILFEFRGNSDLHAGVAAKKRSVKTFLVYGFVFVQFCILGFQVHELLRYSAEIEPFMPSMTIEGDAGIMAFFHFGVILIPAACQFVFLLMVWLMVLEIAKNSWHGGLIAVVSVWIATFSWNASLMGFIYTIMTFD